MNKYTYAIYKLALNFIFDRIHERFFARPTLPVRHLDVSLVATTLDDSLPGRFAIWSLRYLDVYTFGRFHTSRGVHSIDRWKQDASWKKLGGVKNSKLSEEFFSGGEL